MRENYPKSLKLVLEHEGGWADHPKDPGGATMKGVTIAVYREYKNDPLATKAQLKAITPEELFDIYKKRYWDKCRCDDLPSGVDYAVFDFAVNSGVSRASRYLQRVAGVNNDDGVIGPASLAVIKTKDPDYLIKSLCANRLAFMRSLPIWPTFGKGWQKRVDNVEKTAYIMS